MQRRKALQQLGMGITMLTNIPAWANGWRADKLKINNGLLANQADILAEIAETIIPETSSPGAKTLGVDKLIQKLVIDCQGPEAAQRLSNGLLKIDSFAKSSLTKPFAEFSAIQKADFLKGLETNSDPELKNTYSQIRRMTIDGYIRSEYFMVNVQKYEWAPARFYGCVPVK
jgi:hypothetical protein